VPALHADPPDAAATLELTAAGLGWRWWWRCPGIVAALRRNSLLDAVCSVGVLLGRRCPYTGSDSADPVFAVKLGWFPAAGRDGLLSLVLPAVALGASRWPASRAWRARGCMEVLAQILRTARAAGVSAFRGHLQVRAQECAIPLVTIVGLEFGVLLGGAVITETIFAWRGGPLAVDAIFIARLPAGQAIVAMLATLFVSYNLVMDLVYNLSRPPRIASIATIACNQRVVALKIASTASRPTPGQREIVSVITAPPSSTPNSSHNGHQWIAAF